MIRQLPEWIGTHPGVAIPPRVKLRIWERCKGACGLSGRKIMPGDRPEYDHIIALVNGGEHRESNLQVVIADKHKIKTAADVAEKARIRSTSRPMDGSKNSPWRKPFNGSAVRRHP
jgi:5-methylcytosine-specific restriction protein A